MSNVAHSERSRCSERRQRRQFRRLASGRTSHVRNRSRRSTLESRRGRGRWRRGSRCTACTGHREKPPFSRGFAGSKLSTTADCRAGAGGGARTPHIGYSVWLAVSQASSLSSSAERYSRTASEDCDISRKSATSKRDGSSAAGWNRSLSRGRFRGVTAWWAGVEERSTFELPALVERRPVLVDDIPAAKAPDGHVPGFAPTKAPAVDRPSKRVSSVHRARTARPVPPL